MTFPASSMDLPRDKPVVAVHTTNGRGFSPDEVAVRCAERLISISETAPPAIREQALAYQSQITKLLAHYMREAIASDRTTVYNILANGGHHDAAELIRRL